VAVAFSRHIDNARPLLVVNGTATAGSAYVTATPPQYELWALTDLDIFFHGDTNGDLTWLRSGGLYILDWRPGSTNQQSEHWTGFQCLVPGEHWTFSTPGGLGFDVVGWAWVLPNGSDV